MHIVIRVDASATIGLGHLRRCLSLAQALRAYGGVVRFVSRRSDVDVAATVEALGFACTLLPETPRAPTPDDGLPHAGWLPTGWATDATQTLRAAGVEAADWVVVDHYALDGRWHEAVRAGLGSRIAAIDDLGDRSMVVDLLVDPNYCDSHAAKYAGRLNEATALLGGPRYALLAPAYADAPRYEFHAEVRSVGIFMGGTDTGGNSALALEASRAAGFGGPVEVATTRSNPHFAAIERAVSDDQNARLTADLPELSAFFARHDLQIGAGGGASWERCCIGAPTLTLVCASNQLAVVPSLARLGVVAAPEPVDSLEQAAVAVALRTLLHDAARRQQMAARSRELVDGKGANRVAAGLLATTLAVRPACPEDATLLHLWRNHPSTRAVSLDRSEIAWEDHVAWVRRTLLDPERSLLIGCLGKVPAGVIRFDRGSDHFEVSLYLDPNLHGLGLGSALLRAGEDHVLARDANGATLAFVASVLEENRASQRIFERGGYQRSGPRLWRKMVGAVPRRQR